jgi:hypothetical protein
MGAWGLVLAFGFAPSAWAAPFATDGSRQDPSAVDEAVTELEDEFDQAMNAFQEKYQAATTDAERQKAFDDGYPDASEWFPRFLAIADEHPGSDAALRALVWIIQRGSGESEQEKIANEYLFHDYLLHAGIGALCDSLHYRLDSDCVAALRQILGENPAREAKAAAAFALGKVLLRQAEIARMFAGGGGERSGWERQYGKPTIDVLSATDPAVLQKEAEGLFERVSKEFADVPGSGSDYAARAEGELFELRNLQVGKVAPEVAGEDIDGAAFKLSDYRGKVVLIDFWGHW